MDGGTCTVHMYVCKMCTISLKSVAMIIVDILLVDFDEVVC